MRTTYDPDRKAEALRLLAEVGLAETARRTGIPEGTVASWGSRAGVKAPPVEALTKALESSKIAWAERKLALGEKLGMIAEKAADRIVQRIDADHLSGMRDLSVTMGILIDKAQLLTGGATTRTEIVERTPEAEAEVAAVLNIARAA